MIIIYALGWLYTIGIGVMFLYWLFDFTKKCLTKGWIGKEGLKYFLKVLLITVPLSWFGLYISIKARKRLKTVKQGLYDETEAYGFQSDNTKIMN